jgi:hypothetical protein
MKSTINIEIFINELEKIVLVTIQYLDGYRYFIYIGVQSGKYGFTTLSPFS